MLDKDENKALTAFKKSVSLAENICKKNASSYNKSTDSNKSTGFDYRTYDKVYSYFRITLPDNILSNILSQGEYKVNDLYTKGLNVYNMVFTNEIVSLAMFK